MLGYYHQGRIQEARRTLARHRDHVPRRDSRRSAMLAGTLGLELHFGLGESQPLGCEAARLEGLDHPAARAGAAVVRAVVHLLEGDPAAARKAQDQAPALLENEAGLPRVFHFYRDLPGAVLAALEGDRGDLRSLIEETASDEDPFVWIVGHPRLEGLAQVLRANGQPGLASEVVEALGEHDPAYEGYAGDMSCGDASVTAGFSLKERDLVR